MALVAIVATRSVALQSTIHAKEGGMGWLQSGLVGHDVAPTVAFGKVKTELESRGWQVEAFLGGGKPIGASPQDIKDAIEKAKVVLLGMSYPADHAAEEIAAGVLAFEKGKPFGFYADTFGAWQRSWFSELLPKASFLFVLNDKEKEAASYLHLRADAIVVAGNHSWEEASFPRYSREDIRAKLGIARDETMVFVAGHKSVPISAFLLMGVVHALNQPEAKGRKWQIVFAPHPGDGVSPNTYAEPMLFTDIPVRIVSKTRTYLKKEVPGKEPELEEREGGHSSSDLLPAADLLAESASTFCQAAAILRIPIVSFFSEISKKRNVSAFGRRDWEPVLQGVAREVYGDANKLAETMISELVPDSIRDLRRRNQEQLYPGFKEKGQFTRIIASALARF